MADLDVEPKKRSSIFPWLLLGLGLIALLFFLTRRTNEDDTNRTVTTNTTTATSTTSHAASADQNWDRIDFNAPAANYNEITDRNVTVRGNNEYAIYTMDEDVLFDDDKSTFKANAAKNLQQVANSIQQRYTNGQIRIYGDDDKNKNDKNDQQLAQQRAEAIRNWLTQNGNIPANRISIHPANATTNTASGNTSANPQPKEDIAIVARRS